MLAWRWGSDDATRPPLALFFGYARRRKKEAVAGGGEVSDRKDKKGNVRLTDEQRIDWLRLIRSPNVGPRGTMQHEHLR